MATLNSINLGINTRWLNEFEGSAIANESKFTEDGRQFIFQKKKQKFRAISYDCTGEWMPYATVKQLAEIRDSGQSAVLTHNDGRVFNVLLDSIEGLPRKGFSKHSETSHFQLTLHFTEI